MTGMREHHASAYARASFEHDAAAHATDGRTDGLTQKDSPDDESFRIASRAGGHTNSPHVYLVNWPAHGIVKVGISTRVRWNAWRSRGMREIGFIEPCCISHALRVEAYLLRHLAAEAPRAFSNKAASRIVLGDGVGWTECYRPGVCRPIPQLLLAAFSRYDPAWFVDPARLFHPKSRRTA